MRPVPELSDEREWIKARWFAQLVKLGAGGDFSVTADFKLIVHEDIHLLQDRFGRV